MVFQPEQQMFDMDEIRTAMENYEFITIEFEKIEQIRLHGATLNIKVYGNDDETEYLDVFNNAAYDAWQDHTYQFGADSLDDIGAFFYMRPLLGAKIDPAIKMLIADGR
ncbi:hypothetical protein, partial [Enterococcus faecalis]|uniref:hypothetical protein n=1 Tax=Enterococcus faecalis TaxID=1351 RepID=UPI001E5DF791